MLGKEQLQVRNLIRKHDQGAQGASCLARAKFFNELHNKVSGGLLSVADAEKQVKDYDHPTSSCPQPIVDRLRTKSREIPVLKSIFATE